MNSPKFSHRIILDFETTGLDKFRDGILEVFAKVICLASGREIDSFKAACKSESFKIPSPKALFANNYKVVNLVNSAHPLEVATSLFNFIKRYPNAEILAFNANFDFGFSYNAFFQSIKGDPYAFKTDGRSVICVMEIIRALEATTCSSTITVPLINGARSFKQEDVCFSSGIFYLAHSAESDVRGLEKLLEIISLHHSDYLQKGRYFSKKSNALNFINSRPFFVTPIGFRNRYSVRCLVPLALCDKKINMLCADIGRFTQMDFEHMQSRLNASDIAQRNLNEPEPHYPLIEVPLNKSKIFFDESYYECSDYGLSVGKEKLAERANAVFKNAGLQDFAERILHFKKLRFEAFKTDEIEEKLFDDFPSSDEIGFINDFDIVPVEDKYRFLIQEKGNFKNNRYHKLARRFLLDAYPENCPESTVEKFNEWKRCRLFGASNGKIRTFQDAGNEISYLRRHHPNSMDRINEIENYLSFREDEIENAI